MLRFFSDFSLYFTSAKPHALACVGGSSQRAWLGHDQCPLTIVRVSTVARHSFLGKPRGQDGLIVPYSTPALSKFIRMVLQ